MKCPNCGHDIPYQSVNQRIAEWAANKYGFDPKEFVEVSFSPYGYGYFRGVDVSIHYWKDSDYKVEKLGHYEGDVPAVIEDMYEYKQAMERAREMRRSHG